MSYAAFAWEDYTVDAHEVPVDGTFEFGLTVRNTGEVAGSEVVRLYLHDPYAQTTRPWAWLVYAKVSLDPGEAERIRFIVSAENVKPTSDQNAPEKNSTAAFRSSWAK